MNATQAKKIGIVEFLTTQGVEPQKMTHEGRKAIYLSPFRQENNASFHVDVPKNVWYDHGVGVGGNIIDLVMRMKNTDFADVLQILGNQEQISTFSYNQQIQQLEKKRSVIEIIERKRINHSGLKSYLLHRRINPILAMNYIQEIHYRMAGNQRTFFAIGFKNEKGGLELRNKYFKGSTSPKYYSLIQGKSDKKLNVFEGFFDFLSALVLSKKSFPNFDSLILNSTANIRKTVPLLSNYPELNLLLDNDNTGKQAVSFFQNIHPKVNDLSSSLYPNDNDLNDFLVLQMNRSK